MLEKKTDLHNDCIQYIQSELKLIQGILAQKKWDIGEPKQSFIERLFRSKSKLPIVSETELDFWGKYFSLFYMLFTQRNRLEGDPIDSLFKNDENFMSFIKNIFGDEKFADIERSLLSFSDIKASVEHIDRQKTMEILVLLKAVSCLNRPILYEYKYNPIDNVNFYRNMLLVYQGLTLYINICDFLLLGWDARKASFPSLEGKVKSFIKNSPTEFALIPMTWDLFFLMGELSKDLEISHQLF